METYSTLSEAMNALKEQGYTRDFNLLFDKIECSETKSTYDTTTFKVDRFFRFEGMNDPDDSSILFAISASDGSKGVLVDAYGAYAANVSPEMMAHLKMPS